MRKNGFAFLPAVMVIAALMVGAGAGAVITKQVDSGTGEDLVAGVVVQDEFNTSSQSISTPTSTRQDIVSTTSIEDSTQNISNQGISSDQNVDVAEGSFTDSVVDEFVLTAESDLEQEQTDIKDVSVENIVSQESVSDTQTSVTTTVDNLQPPAEVQEQVDILPETEETEESERPSATSPELLQQNTEVEQLAYDRTKTRSNELTDAIKFIENRYDELDLYRENGIEICESQYKLALDSAKSRAANTQTTYNESRSGYATQPSALESANYQLEAELLQIESDYERCKLSYPELDSSILRDIKSIESKQRSIIRDLELENALESLEDMMQLHDDIITLSYKF